MKIPITAAVAALMLSLASVSAQASVINATSTVRNAGVIQQDGADYVFITFNGTLPVCSGTSNNQVFIAYSDAYAAGALKTALAAVAGGQTVTFAYDSGNCPYAPVFETPKLVNIAACTSSGSCP